MQKIDNWDNVKATGDYARPGAGGYVFVINSVQDKITATGKHYLEIACDIADGEFKGFAKEVEKQFGNKNSYRIMKAYYEGKAAGLFKRFIDAVTDCNSNYRWDWDEQKLVGKFFGAVLCEREYLKDDNTIGLASEIHYPSTTTIAKIRKGEFKIIPLEKLAPANVPAPTQSAPAENNSVIGDEECPF